MAAKYLPHFPKPVLDDLVTGKWLPVIGAGMSLNAVVPDGKKMPLWAGMGKELTDEQIGQMLEARLKAIAPS